MPQPDDQYGKLRLPGERPGSCSPAGDPGLAILGEYLQKYLNTYTQQIWGDEWAPGSGVAPGNPVVRELRYHNPKKVSFNDNDCPALYLWRTGSTAPPEWLCEDSRVTTEGIAIHWISPAADQDAQAARDPFINALVKAVDDAISSERDPCFILSDDEDEHLELHGSDVWKAMRAFSLRLVSYKPEPLVIRMLDGSEPMTFPGVLMMVELREELTHDLDAYDVQAKNGGTIAVSTNDPDGESPEDPSQIVAFETASP